MALQIIGAGYGRTGTMSLKHALEMLGFGPCYHMIELTNEPERVGHWLQAAKGKKVKWEKLFEGYQSIADFPGCLYYQSLLQAYPQAKVILTVRDAESWYKSARSTIFRSYPSGGQLAYIAKNYWFSKRVRQLMQVGWLIQKTIFWQTFRMRQFSPASAMRRFEQHNEEVIKHVPPQQLLVYNVKDGWEPLCQFLQVPIPQVPFPQTNKGDHFHKMKGITLHNPVSEDIKKG